MNFTRDPTNTDEYFLTAHQIFDCCGIESSSTLHVDAIMDKFAPFVKTNKAEFSFLKTLLDPDQCNPEINVSNLANALHQYTESQKTKMDLDESFNLRSGQAPQDSDSGISTDGLQLLEELQSELKEKEHLAHQLRNQLDFTDRQHEETIAALTAERDSLKRHLNMLREENATLTHVRRDYDEACERLCSSGTALDEAKRELEAVRRRARLSRDQLASLEADKLSLQELLSKSKDECHRINEMYASRQSALLEENETLKTVHADLTSKLQDQDEFMQQVMKEKVLLEMELKDMLNKSNQSHMRFDRSIDVSYTDDQMLTALDSLNADSRFSTDNRILDEDSFMNALRDNQGRSTNMSLFDEIRMSFNVSRLNFTEFNLADSEKCSPDNSIITTENIFSNKYGKDHFRLANACVETQTDTDKNELFKNSDREHISVITASVETQTDTDKNELCNNSDRERISVTTASVETQTETNKNIPIFEHDKDNNQLIKATIATQTEIEIKPGICNRDDFMIESTTQTESRPNKSNKVEKKDLELQTDFASNNETVYDKTDLGMHTDTNENELYSGGDNAQSFRNQRNVVRKLNFENSIEGGSHINDNYAQSSVNVTLKVDMEIQTESSMQNGLYINEKEVQFLDAKDFTTTATQTFAKFIHKRPNIIKKAQKLLKLQEKQIKYSTKETQTDEMKPYNNNNNAHCTKCIECNDNNNYANKLERDLTLADIVMKEMQTKLEEYEKNLMVLDTLIGRGKEKNEKQQALVDSLRSKIDILEAASETQREVVNKILSTESSCVQIQTEFDQASVSTQADVACQECVRRAVVSPRGLRKFFWEPLKCLFQMFAVVCFLGAISLLYTVSQRGRVRCDREREATPWRWFDAQDVMDLLLRIEYTAEVPM